MSSARRAALLAFARQHQAVVIEDDYDGEFRFGGRPLDALQTLDRNESVFFVGTFSKCLFPALRLGYVVAPPWGLLALVAAKQRADWHCNLLAQDTLAAFIAEGHLARHVRKMRAIYAERRSLLLDGLQTQFARWLRPVPSTAGLHVAALAAREVDVDAVVERARRAGVGVYPLQAYGEGRAAPRGLLFGFGAIEASSIAEALTRLHSAFAR